MHLFILLTTLLVINISNIKIQLHKEKEGGDERYTSLYQEDKELIVLIEKNENNLNVLKKLQSNLSIQDKFDIIEKNELSSTYKNMNMKAGGLMDDWEFDIS
jgi:hypothetical protein